MSTRVVPSVTTYICDGCAKEQEKPHPSKITFVREEEWATQKFTRDYCYSCFDNMKAHKVTK